MVDPVSGDVVRWLTPKGVVSALYDVVVLPGRRMPTMIGFRSDEIRRVISMEGSL